MKAYDPNETVRECVSCKRCYPSNMQFCRDCMVELTGIEMIPYVIDGRYRLGRVITRGGTGIVFAGEDEQGNEVAVKVIRASVIADPRAQDRLQREARLAIECHHPRIAAVYGFGMLPDASAYIASELVKGASLRNEMKRRGKFDVETTVAILGEVCDALDEAHKAGLVHRDLKPESIILAPSDGQAIPQVKLVDFSFTKFASGKQFTPGTTARLQGQGQLPLRPTYLSPEQFRGQEADLRSDIYSLGVIAYEMLGNQPPFVAGRVSEFGVKLLNQRPPSLRALNPEVNLVLEAEILRALEKDPIDRHQRALDLRRAIRNALHMH
ncbi:MAG: serine/threonine protein kinase [Blastocatellia bacterium]